MLDIGWSELLVVAVVAIVVVGPKELPKLMRSFGFYAGKVKRAAADFRRQFDEAMVESEADEVRKNIEAIRSSMGGNLDLQAPIDQPAMTPTPAPAAIEKAIVPPPEPTAPRPEAEAKSATEAKPEPEPKTAPKPKTSPKTAPKPKTASKAAAPRKTAKPRRRTAKAEPKP